MNVIEQLRKELLTLTNGQYHPGKLNGKKGLERVDSGNLKYVLPPCYDTK